MDISVNFDDMEKKFKKEKAAMELKIKESEVKQAKLKSDDDFNRKQREDWNAQAGKRASELEDTLKSKRDDVAKLEREYVAKAADLGKKQAVFDKTKTEQDKKIKDQTKRLEDLRNNVENHKQRLET